MPTYEYVCKDCGQHIEVVQSFRDDALDTCGSCSGRLRKVFSASGIIFRGSGYYVNDTRSGSADGASSEQTSEKTSEKTSSDGASSDSAGSKDTSKDSGSAAGSTTSDSSSTSSDTAKSA